MKILIIQTAFLGDVVLTIPLIQAAKKYLKSEVSVLCIPSTQNILESHPSISELIVYDKKGKDKGLMGLLKVVKKLREKKYDISLIPHPSFKSGLIAYLSGIPKRIGLSNSAGRIFFTGNVFFDKEKYQLERYLDLLKYFDIEVREEKTEIYIDKKDEEYVANLLAGSEVFFGINPGSVWATKRWPAKNYAELSDRIVNELGGKIIIFGGPDDIEVVNTVVKNMGTKAINLAGKTTIKQLAALIKKCKIFITNDSGPMHIAAAFNVPTVAVFGPTVKELGFFPYSKKAVVIEKDIPCRPCGRHGPNKCPQGDFKCMNEVSVDDVFKAVKTQYENITNN
ncbi:MAG: lipopolysaccharide heptosyltransferase II [Elusimicrobia bacterium]|nr:lipopolysaccharide heptosyltransferase II [Elusimicrobiota bacterium]